MKKKIRWSAINIFAVIVIMLSACGNPSSRVQQSAPTEEVKREASTHQETATQKVDSAESVSEESPADQKTEASAVGENADQDQKIEVDENLLTVDITLPASMFEGKTESEIQQEAKDNGYLSCVVSDDGSVTYKMTKKQRDDRLQELGDTYSESLQELVSGGENGVDSFSRIEHNDDFSEINVYVDPEKYSFWDNFYSVAFYLYGQTYQSFAGVDADKIDVVVNYIDNQSDEVLDTASYKEYMKNQNDLDTETAEADDTADENTETDTISKSSPIPVAEDETITIEDICEFSVDYTNITDDVVPPSPDSWYTHYQADQDKKYVDLCIAYKNLGTSNVDADDVGSAILIFADKYKYVGSSMIEEDNRGDFTYSNITSISPLSIEYIHYLFEIPDEVADSEGNLDVVLTIDERDYLISVREGETGDILTPDPKAVMKLSGSIGKGEIIVIPNVCEFYIDYSDITKDVVPKNPDDWYSHYEADEGKVYVDICFAYKNWEAKRVIAGDVISADLRYASKYEYKGSSMIEEDNRGDFTYSNITGISPLCTEYIHYLFAVPEEVQNSEEPIEITFTIGKNTYTYSVR